jgi:long-chain acyl-CoA synthetase
MAMDLRYFVERAARLYGPLPAITCGQQQYSVAEVVDRARRLGNALFELGCRPGDRVGLYLANCAEYLEIELALSLAGLTRVALNVRLGAPDLTYVLKDAGAKALIYDGGYAREVRELAAQVDGLAAMIRLGEATVAEDSGLSYESVLAAASAAPRPSVDPESLYSLFYTSGTTGRPKGVMLSHRSQLSVAFSLLLEFGPVIPGDRSLLLQPLSHGSGFFMLPNLLAGGHLIVMTKFDAAGAVAEAEKHRVHTIKLVPTMLVQMLRQGMSAERLPSVQRVIYGGSPIASERLVEAIETLGPVLYQLYGQAEAPMCITVLPPHEHRLDGDRLQLASAGRAFTDVEVRVVDEEGNDVKVGKRGEVIVRGRHLMSGYWGRPDQTDEVLRDGFVHTRDMAILDERGFVYLQGRSDDMIISGGMNIAPRAVEDVLHQHPDVLEAVVIGVPDDLYGEAVKAYVVLREGSSQTKDALIDFCRPRLGLQKPRDVEFVAELPKNAYGKIIKAELKERHMRALAGNP